MKAERACGCKKKHLGSFIKPPTPKINRKLGLNIFDSNVTNKSQSNLISNLDDKTPDKNGGKTMVNKLSGHKKSFSQRQLSPILSSLRKDIAPTKQTVPKKEQIKKPEKTTGKIQGVKNFIDDIRSQYEEKESKLAIENKLLKEKLEEQIQYNKDIKKLMISETKRIDGLVKRLDKYIQLYTEDTDDIHIDQTKSQPKEIFSKRSRNRSSSFSQNSYAERNLRKKSLSKIPRLNQGNKSSTTKDLHNFDPEFISLSKKVDDLFKIDRTLQSRGGSYVKHEMASECKASGIEKISELYLTEEEVEGNVHNNSPTSTYSKNNNTKYEPKNPTTTLNQPQDNIEQEQPASIIVTCPQEESGEPLVIETYDNESMLLPKEEVKKYHGSFNESALNGSKLSQNLSVNRSHEYMPMAYQGKKESDLMVSVWIDDDKVTSCMLCHSDFWLFTRKHHCRVCGKIFCNRCSKYIVIINGKKCRSCKFCKENYEHSVARY